MSDPFPMFRAQSLGKSFNGDRALSGLDFSIDRGESLAVLGPSGAGKTTLLHIMGGRVRHDTGELWLDGTPIGEITDPAERARKVGIMHQQFDLVDQLPTLHNVLAGTLGQQNFLQSLKSLVWPNNAQIERAHQALERVGIGDKIYQKTAHLSGGEQQRVALARLLVQKPEVILADEPVASVDPARARTVLSMLVDIAREDDITLVVSLHAVSFAQEFFPRIMGLRQGTMFFDRPTDEVDGADLSELYELAEGQVPIID